MFGYDVQNLGAIGFVVDMNNSAQLAGYTVSGPQPAAFLYSNGTAVSVGTLPGFTRSVPNAINNLGAVVGYCDTPPKAGHAFLYQNGAMTDLHPLLQAAGYTGSEAFDINDKGMIVGDGNLGPWLIRDGKLTILRQAPGVPPNALFPAINNSGIVAFGTEDSSGLYRYDSNTNKGEFLGSFGGNVSIFSPGVINDSGQIAGCYQGKSSGAPILAYLYSQSLQALGINVSSGQFKPPDLNSQGQLVFGTRSLYDNGTIIDLQSVLPSNFLANVSSIWGAALINDGGQLICYGDLPGDVYLLTPRPVPSLPADKIAELVAYVRILIGVVEGGGGLVILPNGSIIRIPPVGPPPGDPLTGTVFQLLSRLASGLAVRESASTIADSKLQSEVQAAAAKLIRTAVRDALALLTKQAPEEGS